MATSSPKSKRAKKDKHSRAQQSSECNHTTCKRTSTTADVFVGNIPKAVKQQDLVKEFTKFGKVVDLCIHDKEPKNKELPKFAFVSFDKDSAALKAIEADGTLQISSNHLHIEERKPKNHCGLTDKPDQFWLDLLQGFDWKRSAAIYAFRERTMEDYLAEYISIFACARGLREEKLAHLMTKLMEMAESKPEVIAFTLPPHLCGMICNKIENKRNGDKFINMKAILQDARFVVKGDTVEYVAQDGLDDPSDAKDALKKLLVEGLFIYFFAKFSHGPVFKIKYTYYAKSEPIRTVLITLTGQKSINKGLEFYFDLMKEAFKFDTNTYELSLTKDFYKKDLKDELKRYLATPLDTTFQKLQVSSAVGLIKEITDTEAQVEFCFNESTETALLKRINFKNRTNVAIGQEISFNATKEKGKKVWICTAAWIPGMRWTDLKCRVVRFCPQTNQGLVDFFAPNGAECQANFEASQVFNVDPTELVEGLQMGLDVDPLEEGGTFRAYILWSGKRPSAATILRNDFERQINQSLVKTGDKNNNTYDGLPLSVQSTLHYVLDDDSPLPQHLLDLKVLNFVLQQLGVDDEKLVEIQQKLEQEAKSALATILTNI